MLRTAAGMAGAYSFGGADKAMLERVATLAAFRHLGVTPPKASGQDLFGA